MQVEQISLNRMRNERGAILPLLLTVIAVIGVVSYVVMRLMSQVMDRLGDDDIQVEAQMLASDMKEYTKYLLAYEKILFVKNPMRITKDRQGKLEKLWGQGFAAYDMSKNVNMINVCGGYTAGMQFVGNLSLGGDAVLCPNYLRDPNRTGKETEDMLLNQWANKNRDAMVLEGNNPTKSTMADTFEFKIGSEDIPDGQYRVRLDFSGDDGRWFEDPDNTVTIDVGQKIFVFLKDRSLGLSKGLIAEVFVDIFTDSFGMRSDFTERFMRVTSRVTYTTPAKGTRIFVDQESFVLRIPTIKDFVIFAAYPTDQSGKPTKSFKESMKLGPGSKINGRVYFNGNIDTDLKDLPEFLEPVFISGTMADVKATDMMLFRQKFRRGLVTNLSMARYLFEGQCPLGTGTVRIINGTDLQCTVPVTGAKDRAFEMKDLLNRMQSVCRCAKVNVGANGLYSFGAQSKDCADPQAFQEYACPSNTVFWVQNGFDEVEVGGTAPYAFIASPVGKLKVSRAKSNIYGVIVGGYIDAQVGAVFNGITAMKEGDPGLGNKATLQSRTEEVNSIQAGVGAPLPNFPLIQFVKDGFK